MVESQIECPPDEYMERVREILPPDLHLQVEEALFDPRPVWVRVNTLVAEVREVARELAELTIGRGPWPEALRVSGAHRTELLRHPLSVGGAVYMQSVSSQSASLALDPQPGEEILDLCAAPGSKTSHIAQLMGEGTLVANEVSKGRSYKLRAVLDQLRVMRQEGLDVRVRTGDGVRYRGQRECFDRILVDAPCSGEGRFHVTDPASWKTWGPRKIKGCASKQKALLHAAIDAVRPGGVIVYSTCTMAPEENELVLKRALKRYAGRIEIEPLPTTLPTAIPALCAWRGKELPAPITEFARRIPPGPEWDGFFIARIRKSTG